MATSYLGIYDAVAIHPTRIAEFQPLTIYSKNIEDLIAALKKLNFHFQIADKQQDYLLLKNYDDIEIRLENFYDHNEKERRRKDKNIIIIQHGIRCRIKYNHEKIALQVVTSVENTLVTFYREAI